MGDDCGDDAQWCIYGDDVRAECRDTYFCTTNGWGKEADCREPAPDLCPATPPTGACDELASDDPQKRICGFDDGTLCTCNSCSESDWCWECIDPPEDSDCPNIAPNTGSSCPEQGTTCDYGDPCQGGARRICREGIWYPLAASGCGE